MNEEVLEFSYKKPVKIMISLYTRDGHGSFVELEGGGYAPQPYSDNGVKFPTATAKWSEICGYGVDYGGYKMIKGFDQGGPITLQSGDTFSVSLQVSHG